MDLKFKDNSKLRIAPFTQLEYIESTGTQWIDTDYKFTTDIIKVEAKFEKTDGKWFTIGNNGSGTNNTSRFEIIRENDALKVLGNPQNLNVSSTANEINELIVNFNNGTLSATYKGNTSTVNRQNSLKTNTNNILVGKRNNDASSLGIGIYKIWYLRIYDNDILVRDLIPSKDNNNVVCMYDTVSEQFFYNQGTGNFVAGHVVKSGLPETIILKTTTLYHKNTPNVDGLLLLNDILNSQETAEDVVLNRIRVDIGNVSGSLFELMKFAGMAGFNDNYEPQIKPRLIGTWTINDWYTSEQLAQAQAAFDGLTIVDDPNYIIDFSQLAVQTLDDTQPNYNPAVAIILQTAGRGVTLNTPVISGQTGRWFLTKTQAATITSISTWFQDKTTVSDTSGIVSSDTTASYNFSSFDEFQYFIGTTSCNCANCTNLVSIRFPNTITNVNLRLTKIVDFYIPDNLVNCSGWQVLNISTIERVYIDSISHWESLIISASNFKSNHGYLLYVNNLLLASYTPQINSTKIIAGLFYNCKNSFIFNNISSIETIDSNAFNGCDNLIINDWTNWNVKHYKAGCLSTSSITIPQAIINKIITVESDSISKCNSEEDLILNNVITYSGSNFASLVCGNISKNRAVTLGSSLSSIDGWLYFNFMSCTYLHILASTPPTLRGNKGAPSKKIYVGDGSSAAHDDAILADYLADTNWATYSSKLNTWYNYLHPTT